MTVLRYFMLILRTFITIYNLLTLFLQNIQQFLPPIALLAPVGGKFKSILGATAPDYSAMLKSGFRGLARRAGRSLLFCRVFELLR